MQKIKKKFKIQINKEHKMKLTAIRGAICCENSKESIRSVSEICKNRIYSAEQRERMSIAAQKREDNMTEEQRQLRRASMKET